MLRKTYRLRLVLLSVISILVFGAIEARLAWLQVVDHETYVTRARYQQHRTFNLAPRRGDIVDRQGNVLASSHFTETIILDTRAMKKAPDPALIEDLARAMTKPVEMVRAWFDTPARRYVYRKAPDEVLDQVAIIEGRDQLPEQLIQFETTSKRGFPHGTLAAHILGFTTIDEHGSDTIGIAGLERQYNDWLKGEYREVRLPVSSGLKRQGLTAMPDEAIESTFGNTLVLTIDQRIQTFAERALSAQVGRYQALGGVAVVMDVTNGEILALANCPDFNLNTFRQEKIDPSQLKNRALTDPIEVGSVMKILTTALLLDRGLISPGEMVDGHGGWIALDGRVIKDAHPMGVVPFRAAFAESSNVVMAALADSRLEPNTYYEGLTRFGLGRPTGLDLGGEGGGVLRPAKEWTALSAASLAIGYETSLTPMQVIAAVGAIGNNGWRMRPHLVREIRNYKGQTVQKIRPEPVERVASAETCRTVLDLMEAVVSEGTAKGRAEVAGYRVGGKTGTTVKFVRDEDGRKRYIASFAGLAPTDNPRLAIYVYVDEPQGAKYGGEVAAPVFQEIAMEALPLLGIQPSNREEYDKALIARAANDPRRVVADAQAAAEANAEPSINELNALSLSNQPALPGVPLGDVPPAIETAAATDGFLMPDCRGLTMIEVWDKLGQLGIPVRNMGSGLCVGQEPPAGGRLPKGQTAKIIFAQPAETEKTSSIMPGGAVR